MLMGVACCVRTRYGYIDPSVFVFFVDLYR